MMGTQAQSRHETLGLGTILRRGLLGRCPNCGQGKLFALYLKQVSECAACGESYGKIRSDDAAPWMTILVVGHIIVPTMFSFERDTAWPEWVSMTVWPALAVLLALLILPRAKGVCLSIIWKTGAPGSE